MKIASVLMTVVFAGVVAQANEPAKTETAPTAPAAAAAPAETKAPAKKKHAKKAGEVKAETKEAAPAGH
ncbi:hypothetical protein [Bdellovibrio sp. ArHS]|uniref:hypothetical protein n=1 Tax=Bdellovibrio sp. ArHS TaxID=1569284 RepID=UPI000A7749E6|nr:hypothetical protein [Bdellovibrio sp. ArHS]